MTDETKGVQPVQAINLTELHAHQADIESLAQFSGLTYLGFDDPDGFEQVAKAQRACARVRNAVDKTRKKLKEPVLALEREIDRQAKEAQAEIAQIEGPLKHQVDEWNREMARREQEAEEARQRALAERVDALRAVGADWSPVAIAEMTDEDYADALAKATAAHEAAEKAAREEKERLEREQAEKDKELAVLREERRALEAEREALRAKLKETEPAATATDSTLPPAEPAAPANGDQAGEPRGVTVARKLVAYLEGAPTWPYETEVPPERVDWALGVINNLRHNLRTWIDEGGKS